MVDARRSASGLEPEPRRKDHRDAHADGTYTFTVKATDSAQPTAASSTEKVTITIAPRRLAITTAPCRAGKSRRRIADAELGDGHRAAAWTVKSGHLSAGLTLDPAHGRDQRDADADRHEHVHRHVTDASTPTPMTATASYTITINPNIQAAVYVTEGGCSGVQSFPLGSAGNVKPTTSITGPATGLDATAAAVIDPVSGTLYIASAGNNEIAEYAYGATGNVAPSAVIAGAATGLSFPAALALDSSGRLYVANHPPTRSPPTRPERPAMSSPSRRSTVPTPASPAPRASPSTMRATSGRPTAAPTASPNMPWRQGRRLGAVGDQRTVHRTQRPVGLTLDHAGNLLVADELGSSLTEYTTSDNGDVSPRRTISGLSLPDGVDVDAQGNIYVANGLAGVSEYAPNASGPAGPTATLGGLATGISGPTSVAVAPPLVVRTRTLRAAHAGRDYRARLRANSAPPRTAGRCCTAGYPKACGCTPMGGSPADHTSAASTGSPSVSETAPARG